jgi:hypothetical protein
VRFAAIHLAPLIALAPVSIAADAGKLRVAACSFPSYRSIFSITFHSGL